MKSSQLDCVCSVADVQQHWRELDSFERARAVHAINQSGTSLRALSKVLERSASYLRYLRALDQEAQGPVPDWRSLNPFGTVIQEVLSRPGESDKPLNEQQYWTLEVVDWTDSHPRGFIVQQACGKWSELDRQFVFDQIETERWPLLIDAEERYESHRLALMKNGFIHSDMEF